VLERRYYPGVSLAGAALKRWRALLVVLLLAACAPQQVFAPRLTSSLPETPTPLPSIRESGGPSGLNAEQGLAVIGQAYALLLDQYVDPVDPAALLRAAWEGFAGALPEGVPKPEPPQFTGSNPIGDLTRFRRAYVDVAAQVGGGNEMQARLAHEAVRKMADSLGDCHTSYSDPQQVQEQLERLQGDVRFGGVGVRIKRHANDPVVVWELLDGGSAGKAGIKPGDAILKVDGHDALPLTLEQLANAIRGPEGSQVKLTIERGSTKKVQDFTLKRVALQDPAVQSKWLREGVGYLRLFNFSQDGRDGLLQAVRDFEAKSPQGWILDLRTNGGGDVTIVTSLLSKFLKNGPFGYQVDRRGQRAALGPDGSFLPRQHPLVVLVSDSTSSGAELFAAAAKQYHAGTVLGTKTAGCVGIASRAQLDDGSGLSVSVAKLLGPTGEELNKSGVTPDEVVEVSRADLAAGRDPQLERALAILGVK
jgi:carboxyl-terminal processing protease